MAKVGGPLCPICGRPSDLKIRPFCSKRCADIDLQRWFSGAYTIPGAPTDEESGPPPGDEA